MVDNSKIQRGKVYAVNNSKIRGHRSLIINLDEINVDTIVFTHAPSTRKIPNIKLQSNPDLTDLDENGNLRNTYILKSIQKANIKDVGKFYPNFKVKNQVDKSIIRKIKNKKQVDVEN